MDCNQFLDSLDAGLIDSASPQMQAHLAGCISCQRAAALKAESLTVLRGLPEPPVPSDLAERVFDFIPKDNRQQHRHSRLNWALSLVAMLMLGVGIGFTFRWAAIAPDNNYQVRNGTIVVPADTVTQVRIALDAAQPLQHVAFTISVPAGMHLKGHAGEQQVAWNGALAQGRNVLNLQLVANRGTAGTLETHLQYNGYHSAYKVHVIVAAKSTFREHLHRLLARINLV